MWVLGINWMWHDSAAALVGAEGQVVAFAEEERFTRVKHAWGTLPRASVDFCLRHAGITWADVDVLAIGWQLPQLQPWDNGDRDRLVEALSGDAPVKRSRPELIFVSHHLAHALSGFYASEFESAGVLVVDGSGETESISIFAGSRSGGLTLKASWPRIYSLGAMYSGATRALGLGYLNEGKTMGLASYGSGNSSYLRGLAELRGTDANTPLPFSVDREPTYNDLTESWIQYFDRTFGSPTRPPQNLDKDIVAVRLAATAQYTLEEAMRRLYAETVCVTESDRVVLVGGVALNSVANGRAPEPVYIPPVPHDAGVALGAAWYVCPPKQPTRMSAYLGPKLRVRGEIDRLRNEGLRVVEYRPDAVANLLCAGRIGAVAERRAEVGPRALCHRSIIAAAHPAEARNRVNLIKGRELWRPLAPVALPNEATKLWPRQGLRELYMVGNTTASRRALELVPAAIHVDGTTRPQVLESGQSPIVEGVLRELNASGLAPALINTSFNGPGEPIVNSARDAIEAFNRLELDFLVLGDRLIKRTGL